jgi:spore coat protein U-like protein
MFSKKMSVRKMLTVAGATALALGGMSGTQAAVDDLDVTATVVANCSITADALDLGNYDPVVVNAATAADAQSNISVTCTSGASATVTLGQGANAGGGSTDADPDRRLANGANRLNYGLFTDLAHADEWGNTAGTGVAHTGTGSAATLVVYGSIPAAQNVPAGVYTDTVVATITL